MNGARKTGKVSEWLRETLREDHGPMKLPVYKMGSDGIPYIDRWEGDDDEEEK